MKRLSKEQVLLLHSQLIESFGGSSGVRDDNLLDSALETPFQTFDGEELYPTLQAKAARLGYVRFQRIERLLLPYLWRSSRCTEVGCKDGEKPEETYTARPGTL